jgi:hypothetical protein
MDKLLFRDASWGQQESVVTDIATFNWKHNSHKPRLESEIKDNLKSYGFTNPHLTYDIYNLNPKTTYFTCENIRVYDFYQSQKHNITYPFKFAPHDYGAMDDLADFMDMKEPHMIETLINSGFYFGAIKSYHHSFSSHSVQLDLKKRFIHRRDDFDVRPSVQLDYFKKHVLNDDQMNEADDFYIYLTKYMEDWIAKKNAGIFKKIDNAFALLKNETRNRLFSRNSDISHELIFT